MDGQLPVLQVAEALAAVQSEAVGAATIEAAAMYVKEAAAAAAAELSGSEAAAGARLAAEQLEVAGALTTTAVLPGAVYGSEAEAAQVPAAVV